jgi:pSer/pThr/pTyr-binding forkhead associated (FHA) protein
MRLPENQVYLPTIAVEPGSQPSGAGVKNRPQPGQYAAQDAPAFALSLREGPGAGKRFVIQTLPAIIGRSLESAILLDADRSVSRQHAEIYQQGGWLFIRDLDSKHGTQVNGVWISDHRLETGDEILIGDTLLVLETGESGRR